MQGAFTLDHTAIFAATGNRAAGSGGGNGGMSQRNVVFADNEDDAWLAQVPRWLLVYTEVAHNMVRRKHLYVWLSPCSIVGRL